jgi:RNA polymerase sigma-70 factor, ECF subfamily
MEYFWDSMYRQVGPDLLAYFTRRHGEVHLAEDLLQDTFIQAIKQDERVRNAVSSRAYLFGIARHMSQEVFRHAVQSVAEIPELTVPAAPAVDPRLEAMYQAIQVLPPAQQEVLELRLRHELSYEEIATVLGIPVGTVRSRLHLVMLRLREDLRRAGND